MSSPEQGVALVDQVEDRADDKCHDERTLRHAVGDAAPPYPRPLLHDASPLNGAQACRARLDPSSRSKVSCGRYFALTRRSRIIIERTLTLWENFFPSSASWS